MFHHDELNLLKRMVVRKHHQRPCDCHRCVHFVLDYELEDRIQMAPLRFASRSILDRTSHIRPKLLGQLLSTYRLPMDLQTQDLFQKQFVSTQHLKLPLILQRESHNEAYYLQTFCAFRLLDQGQH